MPKPLSEIERRVVGVLLEKLLSTPAYYPLTIHALAAGCNQKSNRDPELDLGEDAIRRALTVLQPEGLAISVFAEGARAEKWKTRAHEVYKVESERGMAVLAELLLRGPQTKAELRTRASRMRHEVTAEDLDKILEDLCRREDPLAVSIGRAPGGRAERFAHTLYAEDEMARLKAGAAPAPPGPVAATEPPPPPPEKQDEVLRELAALRARVEALEGAVAELRRPAGGGGAPAYD